MSATLRVLFLRHATTDWNVAKRLQGRVDRPLLASSEVALSRLRMPDTHQPARWFSSPLLRTQQTARGLGAEVVVTAPEIIEMDWGDWEGETVAALRARLGEQMAENEARGADFRPHAGESPREVAARAIRWLRSLTSPAQCDECVVCVTHKGVIRATFAHLWGWDMRGPSPQRFDWNALHEVQVFPDGTLAAGAINIELKARTHEAGSDRAEPL